MLSRFREPSLLELEIASVLAQLKHHAVDSKEYRTIVDNLTVLHKMKEEERKSTSVSKDTLAVIGANLLGILMIIKHENVNVITSRAVNFVMKPR
jgi:hypothetical protein